jgi:hypothetical protein
MTCGSRAGAREGRSSGDFARSGAARPLARVVLLDDAGARRDHAPGGGQMNSTAIKGLVGCAAMVAWLGLFAAGLLVDSKTYRDRINPQPAVAVAAVVGSGSAATGPGSVPPSSLAPRGFDWRAFGGAMLVYTPLNAALLVMIAGLIGGSASSITYGGKLATGVPGPDAPAGAVRAAQQAAFLTENPLASLLRSFLVYVGFMAGIYITSNAPFDNPTADQYVRLVGTLSLLGFVVGYDPTKFQDFLSIVPRPGTGAGK